MDITLYYAPHTCALAPFVTLREAGAHFVVKALNFRKKEQMAPDYLAMNPKHKVPLLVVDGRPLTENPAIQLWIARAFPEARLLPQDPWREVEVVSVLSWCASGIHPHLSRIHSPEKYCCAEVSANDVRALGYRFLDENFRIAEAMLEGREFIFDHFTASDAHMFWCLRRAGQLGFDLTGLPNCRSYFDRMSARDSVRHVLAFEAQTLAAASA